MVEKVTKTVEVPQVQIIEKVVDMPVLKERMVPMIQKVTKTFEVPQVPELEIALVTLLAFLLGQKALKGAHAALRQGQKSVKKS